MFTPIIWKYENKSLVRRLPVVGGKEEGVFQSPVLLGTLLSKMYLYLGAQMYWRTPIPGCSCLQHWDEDFSSSRSLLLFPTVVPQAQTVLWQKVGANGAFTASLYKFTLFFIHKFICVAWLSAVVQQFCC